MNNDDNNLTQHNTQSKKRNLKDLFNFRSEEKVSIKAIGNNSNLDIYVAFYARLSSMKKLSLLNVIVVVQC